jgi:hypothetical protein
VQPGDGRVTSQESKADTLKKYRPTTVKIVNTFCVPPILFEQETETKLVLKTLVG